MGGGYLELLCGTFHSCPTKGYAQSMYFYDKRATVVHVRAAPLVVREKTIWHGTRSDEGGREWFDQRQIRQR